MPELLHRCNKVDLAYFLYDTFAPFNISFLAFGLFVGVAMSIITFLVLAQIVQERGLNRSSLGVLAIVEPPGYGPPLRAFLWICCSPGGMVHADLTT